MVTIFDLDFSVQMFFKIVHTHTHVQHKDLTYEPVAVSVFLEGNLYRHLSNSVPVEPLALLYS